MNKFFIGILLFLCTSMVQGHRTLALIKNGYIVAWFTPVDGVWYLKYDNDGKHKAESVCFVEDQKIVQFTVNGTQHQYEYCNLPQYLPNPPSPQQSQ